MNDIKRSIDLYNMMATRFEKSGRAPNQAKIYREIADFMADCETAEEAAVKIKNSHYYLAPSVAIIKDKLMIFSGVAKDNQLDDLALVYDKKLAEIEEDPGQIYEAGYERTAQNIKIKYSETIDAFCHIYEVYLILSCDTAGDNEDKKSYINEISSSLSKLSTPSSDFGRLANISKFRELIPANDQGYDKFVQSIINLTNFDYIHAEELTDINSESELAWDDLNTVKDLITLNGAEYLDTIKKSRVTVVSPEDENGTYKFIDEEVR